MATEHRISKTLAEAEIKHFIEILKEAKDQSNFDKLTASMKAYLTPETLSFVFYKDQLDYMFSGVQSQGANAFRIYLGANPTTSYPTLVIVPCELNTNESAAQNKLPSPPDDGGDQYPVTFSSPASKDDFYL